MSATLFFALGLGIGTLASDLGGKARMPGPAGETRITVSDETVAPAGASTHAGQGRAEAMDAGSLPHADACTSDSLACPSPGLRSARS